MAAPLSYDLKGGPWAQEEPGGRSELCEAHAVEASILQVANHGYNLMESIAYRYKQVADDWHSRAVEGWNNHKHVGEDVVAAVAGNTKGLNWQLASLLQALTPNRTHIIQEGCPTVA